MQCCIIQVMARSPALHDRVAAGILDIAATVLAEQGEAASMAGIATAAGVARATLYRYFPSRDALLQALYESACAELAERITDAKLDLVPVGEAIARLTRAVIATASKHRALALFQKTPAQIAEADQHLIAPFHALFQRAVEEGALRVDLPAATLVEIYASLLEGIVARVIQGHLGVEEASAAITTVFLTGALSDPKRA